MTFQLLYCFFVIEHGRRKILHFNVTRHPSAEWVVQQLREAFPEAGPYRYAILDRDPKFDARVITFLNATGLKPKRTSIQSPWQNGIAERWSCRREILDHVIALDERHLLRLVRDYVNYHHEDRTHDSLAKDTPNEIEVLRLIAGGLANKEIAARLQVTEETVKSRVKSILSKLHANDRTHAAMVGLKRGIISL